MNKFTSRKNDYNTSLYMSFNSFKRSQISVGVSETDGWRETTAGLYIDPLLLLLTIPHCVIFKAPLALFLFLSLYSTKGPLGQQPNVEHS